MEHFFSNILLALGVAVASSTTEYVKVGSTKDFAVELDAASLELIPKVDGWQVKSNIKRTLFTEIAVKGKKKKGAYYIDKTTTACAQDIFKIDESILYSLDGEVLADGENILEVENPHVQGNFFTTFINILCGVTKNSKPPLIT